MKQALLIDLQNTLIDKNFDQDILIDRVLKLFKETFKLEQEKEFDKKQFESELLQIKSQNFKDKWNLILSKIFKKYDVDQCMDLLKSKIQKNWVKKKFEQILPYVMDNICYADFHYLNIQYDIVFYLDGNMDCIQKLLLETTLNEIIDLTKLCYFEDPKNISLFRIINPQNVYFVAQNIQNLINNFSYYENFQNFNFSNQFIHVYLEKMTRKDYLEQQMILVDKKVQHDLLTMKNLYNKLENIKKMQQKNFDRSKMIKVGVYFEDGIYKHNRKGFVMMDKYPVYFTHFDPLSPNNKKDINIYSAKYSYLMNDYNLLKNDQIIELLKKIDQVLKNIEKQNGYKILIPNNLQSFMVFAERQAMADFFIDLFSQKDFKDLLKKNFGENLTLNYPNTFTINDINAEHVKQQMKENNIQYPLVIKSSYCIAILSKYSHDVIVIRNEEQLDEFFKKEEQRLKAMCPLVVQQYISDLQDIQKIYFIFEEKLLTRYQGIDDDGEDAEALNGHADLKKYSDVKTFSELEEKLQNFIGEELKKKNFYNLGLDLCCKKDSQEFFVIDTNADSLSWMKHGDKQIRQNRYYENMMKCYKEFNQFYYNDQLIRHITIFEINI